MDVDSNTPCYALIEVTYKVTWLGVPGELQHEQTLGFVLFWLEWPPVLGLASASSCGGDKVNSAQKSEGLGSASLRCALVAPGEQKGGQGGHQTGKEGCPG